MNSDARAAVKPEIFHVDTDDLRDARACVVEGTKKGPVATTAPSFRVGTIEKLADLLPGKTRHNWPKTYATLIGLMAATGLRTGEALRLDRPDLDLERGVLTVRETKFHASRMIPIHPSTTEALKSYMESRNTFRHSTVSTRFLVSKQGKPLLPRHVRHTFQKIRQNAHIPVQHGQRPPRLYDLRHTFASQRLVQWYRDGVDVNHAMALLSTYLGHVQVSDTYWYLSGLPELFALVGRRFERTLSGDKREANHE